MTSIIIYDQSEKIVHNGSILSAAFFLAKHVKKDSVSIQIDLVNFSDGEHSYKGIEQTFKIKKKTYVIG